MFIGRASCWFKPCARNLADPGTSHGAGASVRSETAMAAMYVQFRERPHAPLIIGECREAEGSPISLSFSMKRFVPTPASIKSAAIQFLILATDGVWDVTEIGQAVQIVQVRQARQRLSVWYGQRILPGR